MGYLQGHASAFHPDRPDKNMEFINTMLLQYQQHGLLPVWELMANETGTMIGYHSIPVIWDAYQKGHRDFDVQSWPLKP
jgi:putative alpha-1,2-mannosidase